MLAVVIDVLLWRPAMLQDIVIVSVIDDEHSTGLQHAGKVLEACFMIPDVDNEVPKVIVCERYLRSPWSSRRWGNEFPMQRTTSNPPTGFLTSAGSVSQFASSISQSKNAGSLRLSHLVLYAVFNILSEASEDVRVYPSSINMTESTPVPQAASRIFWAFFWLSRFNKKFL